VEDYVLKGYPGWSITSYTKIKTWHDPGVRKNSLFVPQALSSFYLSRLFSFSVL
jgi:hypothetical protein